LISVLKLQKLTCHAHLLFIQFSAKFRDVEDGRSRIDEVVMFILKDCM